MVASYDDAVAELFRGPHATFVAERKRLAGELKAVDKAGAAKLGKLGRPPVSAWAVNQLWWQARADFDALLETAKKMRSGDLGATPAHRDALKALSARASRLLTEAGNAANDATLRRIATTLSAIAAHGGFGPDAAGALSEDRDPPGFDGIGGMPAAPDGLRELAEARQRHDVEVGKARGEVERLRGELGALQRQALEIEGQLVHARARLSELEGKA